MIHLHKSVKGLRKMIEKKHTPKQIESKGLEIAEWCEKLLQEHGAGSKVGRELDTIKIAANKIMRFATTGFDYAKSVSLVDYMDGCLERIRKELNLEWKETQS